MTADYTNMYPVQHTADEIAEREKITRRVREKNARYKEEIREANPPEIPLEEMSKRQRYEYESYIDWLTSNRISEDLRELVAQSGPSYEQRERDRQDALVPFRRARIDPHTPFLRPFPAASGIEIDLILDYEHQREAVAALLAVLRRERHALAIEASSGSGKTTIATALVRECISSRQTAKYTTVGDWLDGYAATWGDNQAGIVYLNTWQRPDVLVIDELHQMGSAEGKQQWKEDAFFKLLKARQDGRHYGKRTVFLFTEALRLDWDRKSHRFRNDIWNRIVSGGDDPLQMASVNLHGIA
jgi:hypothetical protein